MKKKIRCLVLACCHIGVCPELAAARPGHVFAFVSVEEEPLLHTSLERRNQAVCIFGVVVTSAGWERCSETVSITPSFCFLKMKNKEVLRPFHAI
ncbi:hypothetical protein E2C01_007894 [Portunus trituberculatus]|uniref:Secreted protein n=1 Tax=Portunus trituberculatus TaxID=210409 RepID=A0A5B7D1M8_PORTR|nr:hypothetical protein [Portunus trituberculatus]